MNRKAEITVKAGGIFDPARIPIPKYKIGDELYIVRSYHNEVHKVNIIAINYEIYWFDNMYTQRFTFVLSYELSGPLNKVEEDRLYLTSEEATKQCIKQKAADKIKVIEALQQSKVEAENRVKSITIALEKAVG